METNSKQTSKEYFRILSILHLALISGIVLMGIVGSIITTNGLIPRDTGEMNNLFLYIVPAVVIGGLWGSNAIYRNKLNELREEKDLKTKMTNYRSILILRYAPLEGSAFFALVVLLLTGNFLYLAFAAIPALVMLYLRPSVNTVIRDLELNQQEISLVESPDSIIAESPSAR